MMLALTRVTSYQQRRISRRILKYPYPIELPRNMAVAGSTIPATARSIPAADTPSVPCQTSFSKDGSGVLFRYFGSAAVVQIKFLTEEIFPERAMKSSSVRVSFVNFSMSEIIWAVAFRSTPDFSNASFSTFLSVDRKCSKSSGMTGRFAKDFCAILTDSCISISRSGSSARSEKALHAIFKASTAASRFIGSPGIDLRANKLLVTFAQ